jgi:3-oxoacyl-(acyl-carrier-protein) synthase
MAQLDQYGTGGMLQARLRGGRVSAKQLPLGLNTMPADFVNAYVLGNVGCTGAIAGACASFLYNLRLAVEDIQSGRRRLAVVGNAEAPLVPEVIEGYHAMSALATDDAVAKLDGASVPDWRRASRPFGDNCGFVLGESAQYFVLCDDKLALELGADIHGAVPDVFVNADGSLLVNEMAPRPHNSGHHTLDACATSQFEQQLRAVLGLPLGSTRLISPCVMLNLLGDFWPSETEPPDWTPLLSMPDTVLHLYGKRRAIGMRKMGHATLLGTDALEKAEELKAGWL